MARGTERLKVVVASALPTGDDVVGDVGRPAAPVTEGAARELCRAHPPPSRGVVEPEILAHGVLGAEPETRTPWVFARSERRVGHYLRSLMGGLSRGKGNAFTPAPSREQSDRPIPPDLMRSLTLPKRGRPSRAGWAPEFYPPLPMISMRLRTCLYAGRCGLPAVAPQSEGLDRQSDGSVPTRPRAPAAAAFTCRLSAPSGSSPRRGHHR